MSGRRTKCITWGEFKRSGSPIIDESGRRVGFIDFAEWVTLCGKKEENPKEACALDPYKPRPKGVCPSCWKQFRTSMESADMLRSFGGDPVHVVITAGESGIFLGTNKVIVSHFDVPTQHGGPK